MSSSELRAKQVVVTGGSRGIGAACVEKFAHAGADVLFFYHSDKGRAEKLIAKLAHLSVKVEGVRADLSSSGGIKVFSEAVLDIERVHILVNNAGDLIDRIRLSDIRREDVVRSLDLNVISVVEVTAALLPKMRAGASVVNVTSLAVNTGGGPGSSLYCGSKAAILGMTRAWAKELGPQGIRVNAVEPGLIDTDFHVRHETDLKAAVERIPIPRAGEASEVADTIHFLASPASGYTTGASFQVNGGADFS